MCDIARKRPDFRYLVHQTDIQFFKNILETGYILPPRYFLAKEHLYTMRKQNGYRKSLEGVYMMLMTDRDFGKKIGWFQPTNVMLVFPLSLLERDDYYFSYHDQFGDMNRNTFSRKSIVNSKKTNFNPDLAMYKSKDSVGTNEIMFQEKIPMDMCVEVWIPDGSDKTIEFARFQLRTDFQKDYVFGLASKLGRPITYTNKVLPRKQLLDWCDNQDRMQAQKIFKPSFCRSSPYLGDTGFFDKDMDVDELPLNRYTTLAEKKKIALNCGIDPELVRITNNQDLLNEYIQERETDFIDHIGLHGLDTHEKEREYRELYGGHKEKYEPPFTKQIPGYTDSEINAKDPFDDIIQEYIRYTEREIQEAMKHKNPEKLFKEKKTYDNIFRKGVVSKYEDKMDFVHAFNIGLREDRDTFESYRFKTEITFRALDALYEKGNESLLQQAKEYYKTNKPSIKNLTEFLMKLNEDLELINEEISTKHLKLERKEYFPLDYETIENAIFSEDPKIPRDVIKKVMDLMKERAFVMERLKFLYKDFHIFVLNLTDHLFRGKNREGIAM